MQHLIVLHICNTIKKQWQINYCHFLARRLYSEGPALQICNASHPPSVAWQESECAWKFFPTLIVLVCHTGLIESRLIESAI